MNNRLAVFLVIAATAAVASCATQYAPERVYHPYGFFFGFWHGFICMFALIGKLISWLASLVGISFLDSVTVFGKPNTGFGYYCGFVFGLFSFGGGGSSSART